MYPQDYTYHLKEVLKTENKCLPLEDWLNNCSIFTHGCTSCLKEKGMFLCTAMEWYLGFKVKKNQGKDSMHGTLLFT